MPEDAGYEKEIPEKNKKYFRDRPEDPDGLDKYPNTRKVFEQPLTDDQIKILNDVGKALEKDLGTSADGTGTDDDAAIKLKGYVFVVH